MALVVVLRLLGVVLLQQAIAVPSHWAWPAEFAALGSLDVGALGLLALLQQEVQQLLQEVLADLGLLELLVLEQEVPQLRQVQQPLVLLAMLQQEGQELLQVLFWPVLLALLQQEGQELLQVWSWLELLALLQQEGQQLLQVQQLLVLLALLLQVQQLLQVHQ